MNDGEVAMVVLVAFAVCFLLLVCVRYYFQFKYEMRVLELTHGIDSGNQATKEQAASTRSGDKIAERD